MDVINLKEQKKIYYIMIYQNVFWYKFIYIYIYITNFEITHHKVIHL